MSDRVTRQNVFQNKNRVNTRKQSLSKNIDFGIHSSNSSNKQTKLSCLVIKSKDTSSAKKVNPDLRVENTKVNSYKHSTSNNSNRLLSKKRDRSKQKKINNSFIEDRQLLDLDKVRRVVSPPLSLKSFDEEDDNNNNNNNTTAKSQVKDSILQNDPHLSTNSALATNKPKKGEDCTNPIPQKESGYLLRKRLPHQLSQTMDGVISCHDCKEIESVNYFQICFKDDCRESYCLKCIEKYTLLNQSNATVITINENWICFKCQKQCKCLKCLPELKDKEEIVTETIISKPPQLLPQPQPQQQQQQQHQHQVTMNYPPLQFESSNITNNKPKKNKKNIIRIQMRDNNNHQKNHQKHNKNKSIPPQKPLKRVDLEGDIYVYEIPVTHPIISEDTIMDCDGLPNPPIKGIMISDDIIHNKDYCEQYYFLKSIKTNKNKIKKSCAICLHSPFNPTELVRFKAIEEFFQYFYYCYNAREHILCYNKPIFSSNKVHFNRSYAHETNLLSNSIMFYKSMAICKMCIIKSLNSPNNLENVIERLKKRNKRDKDKIFSQKMKEKHQQQCATQSKPPVQAAITTNSNQTQAKCPLKDPRVLNSGILINNKKKANQETIMEKESFPSQTKPLMSTSTPLIEISSSKTGNWTPFGPLINTHLFNDNSKPIKHSKVSKISSLSNTYADVPRLENEQMPSDSNNDHQLTQKASLNTMLSSSDPNISLAYQGFPSSLQSGLVNYPFAEDIYLSIQQLSNTLNNVITDLFVMLSLLLKKNNQHYFTTYITVIEEHISIRLRKAYDTIRQLFIFLDKQKGLLHELQTNVQKLKVVSPDTGEINEIENEANTEFAKFENIYFQYDYVINVYITKFKLTCEYISKQKALIDKYNSLNLLTDNKVQKQ